MRLRNDDDRYFDDDRSCHTIAVHESSNTILIIMRYNRTRQQQQQQRDRLQQLQPSADISLQHSDNTTNNKSTINRNELGFHRQRSPLSISSRVMILLSVMYGSQLYMKLFDNTPHQLSSSSCYLTDQSYLLVPSGNRHISSPLSLGVVEAASASSLMAFIPLPPPQRNTPTATVFRYENQKRKPLCSNNNDNNKASRILRLSTRAIATTTCQSSSDGSYNSNNDVGGYDPSEGINVSDRIREKSNVGNPQQVQTMEKEFSVTSILKELAAIQQQGPQKYCILGTRHCSYLHQQIIELLAYALVLSGNHVYTSGSSGTNAATIRGALRAERSDLLTVVLPQSLLKQTMESQELLKQVKDVVEMPQNNDLSLDIASRICNSYLLSLTDQLISFAFHESTTVIEAAKEAKELDKLVTVLYLD